MGPRAGRQKAQNGPRHPVTLLDAVFLPKVTRMFVTAMEACQIGFHSCRQSFQLTWLDLSGLMWLVLEIEKVWVTRLFFFLLRQAAMESIVVILFADVKQIKRKSKRGKKEREGERGGLDNLDSSKPARCTHYEYQLCG